MSRIHLVKSPQKEFGKGKQILEGDHIQADQSEFVPPDWPGSYNRRLLYSVRGHISRLTG